MHRLLIVLALTALAGVCRAAQPPAPADGPAPAKTSAFVPVDLETDEAIEALHESVEHKQWKRACESLRKLLAKDSATLVLSEPNVYRPVQAFVRESLRKSPPELFENYRALYDAEAQAAFEEWRRSRNHALLARFEREYLPCTVALAALEARGDLLYESGRAREARECYRCALDVHRPQGETCKRFIAKSAGAAILSADAAPAKALLAEMKTVDAKLNVVVVGQPQPVETWLENQLRRLPAAVSPPPAAAPLADIAPGQHVWTLPIEDPRSQAQENENGIRVVVRGGGRMFFERLEAAISDGRLLIPTDNGLVQIRISTAKGSLEKLVPWPESKPEEPWTPAGACAPRGDRAWVAVGRSLVGINLKERKLLWKKTVSENTTDRWFGFPTVYQSLCLTPVLSVVKDGAVKFSHSLYLIERETGRIVSTVPIHDSRIDLENTLELATGKIVVHGQTAWVQSNAGAIAAVDLDAMRVRWLRVYDQSAALQPQMPQGWVDSSATPALGRSVAPVCIENQLVAAPSDAAHWMVLDAQTGAVRRQGTRGGGLSLVGIAGEALIFAGMRLPEKPADGRPVAAIRRTSVLAVSWKTGETLWEQNLVPGKLCGDPVLTRDTVLMSTLSEREPNEPAPEGVEPKYAGRLNLSRVSLSREGKLLGTFSWPVDVRDLPGRLAQVFVEGRRVAVVSSRAIFVFADAQSVEDRLMGAIAAAPNDPAPRRELARMYQQNRQYESALAQWRIVCEKDPKDDDSRRALCDVCVALARAQPPGSAKGAEYLREGAKFAAMPEQKARLGLDLARHFEAAGDWPQAIAEYQRVLEEHGAACVEEAVGVPAQARTLAAEAMAEILARHGATLYDPIETRAGQALAAAADDLGRLALVPQRFPQSAAAEKACRRLGELYRDKSEWRPSSAWFERAARLARTPRARAEALFAVWQNFSQAKLDADALDALERLSREFPDEKFTIGDRTAAAREWAAEAVKPEPAPPVGSVVEAWKIEEPVSLVRVTPARSDVLLAAFAGRTVARLDPATGKKLWEAKVPGAKAAAIWGGIAVCYEYSHVTAVDLSDGRVLWQQRLATPASKAQDSWVSRVRGTRGEESPPLDCRQGVVIVAPSPETNEIAAFDACTGAPLWNRAFDGKGRSEVRICERSLWALGPSRGAFNLDTGGREGESVQAWPWGPDVGNTPLLLCWSATGLEARRAGDGKILWTLEAGQDDLLCGECWGADEVLLAWRNGAVEVRDAVGKVRWKTELKLAATDGSVYVAAKTFLLQYRQGDGSIVVCLDRESGRVLWRRPPEANAPGRHSEDGIAINCVGEYGCGAAHRAAAGWAYSPKSVVLQIFEVHTGRVIRQLDVPPKVAFTADRCQFLGDLLLIDEETRLTAYRLAPQAADAPATGAALLEKLKESPADVWKALEGISQGAEFDLSTGTAVLRLAGERLAQDKAEDFAAHYAQLDAARAQFHLFRHPVVVARKTDKLKVVDGNLDDWDAAGFVKLDGWENIYFEADAQPQAWRGPADLSVELGAAHDDKSLYLAVRVTDDVHANAEKPAALFRGDSLELAFSGGHGLDTRCVIASSNGKTEIDAPDKVVRAAKVRRDDAAHATVYELSIDWTELRIPAGKRGSFNVKVYDADAAEGGKPAAVKKGCALAPGLGIPYSPKRFAEIEIE